MYKNAFFRHLVQYFEGTVQFAYDKNTTALNAAFCKKGRKLGLTTTTTNIKKRRTEVLSKQHKKRNLVGVAIPVNDSVENDLAAVEQEEPHNLAKEKEKRNQGANELTLVRSSSSGN